MLQRVTLLCLFILAACSNPDASKEKAPKTVPGAIKKTTVVKPVSNPWTINSFAPKEGEAEGKKFVRFVTDGDFSDSTQNKNYVYVEVLANKTNGGIFLHELRKSNPAEKFSEPVSIKMTNISGDEIQMTSSRRWNASGGILIEKNNNDYSQFRIFMLQNKGIISVEIRDSGNKVYHFSLNADGFGDSFAKL